MNAREAAASSGPSWLQLPGEMAQRLRDRGWAGHALGPPDAWPPSLRAALQLLLSSTIPSILFWGESRIQFFNDAFADHLDRASLDTALGAPAAQGSLAFWRRHWPWIESLFVGAEAPKGAEGRGGVFAERAAFTHLLLGDPANRYARGGLLLMNREWGNLTEHREFDSPRSQALRHRAVLDAVDEGFCVIGLQLGSKGEVTDYRFLEVNPAFERLTGIVDAVGRTIREIAPRHEQRWFDRYAEVARTGKPMRFEDEATDIAGGRWFDVFAFRVDQPEDNHIAVLFSDITQRKQTSTAVVQALSREREANALIDAISGCAPVGLAFVDRELRFQRVNPRLAEINGLPVQDHIGKRPDELLSGVDNIGAILDRWNQILETGEPWLDVEVQGETPAQPGVIRTWSENFFPVRVDNEIVGIGIVVEETTERRAAQMALAASEERFRALIELGPVGIALSEPDGRIILANDAYLAIVGYGREEIESLNWLERTAPESLAVDHAQLQALREGQPPVPFEKDYIRRDGTRVTALIVAQFVPGETQRMMAYAIDITDRRAAERAVRESEARLRRLIDHMAGFVAMLDVEGTLLEVGEPALRMANLKREDVIGRKFWECPWWSYHPEVRDKVEKWVQEACAGATIREDVFAGIGNGETLAIDFMLVPVFDEAGRVTHVIPSGIDISARKRIELALRENEQRLQETAEALQDADRRKDDFLATLAHELRNPLAPIRNGIQLLRMVAGANPTLERTTVMMERQMQHLVRLVDDLLDVSRITRGKIELRRDLVHLNDIVSSALESCETLFEPHGHVLNVKLADETLCVRGDPDRLRQVFSNLLSNAAKFTPREGAVWVTLEREADQALVKVRDSGIGIPPDRIGNIFEMFAQVDSTHANDGLGIGLALARQLVALHGGTIRAQSSGLGEGSEFIVRLPLASARDSASDDGADGEDRASAGITRSRQILIVDDNIDAAHSLASVLKLNGHTVRTAAGGEEALACFEKEPPDVVLMDLGMPGMDGFTVAKALREKPGGDKLRIIAVTGWGQEGDRERTRAAGMSAHLVKPVDPDLLIQILESDREVRH